MSLVRRSLGFAFLERFLLIGLQLLSFTLLARLLTPAQVGLYSVSMALISMMQVIRDFGLVNYLIQRPQLSREDVGSTIGVSVILGGGLFLLINLAAGEIGRFYGDATLTHIVHIISLNFLILPFNSISIALLRRDMRFDWLMRINLAAAIAGTGTSLGLAALGWGSPSLAWGEIASNMTIAVGCLLSGAVGRLAPPQLARWRDILRFGGPVTAANVVTSASMDINDLALGKLMAFQDVAISSRAQGLMNLFHREVVGTVRTVAYPMFSRVHRENGPMDKHFLDMIGSLTAVAWPFYGFMGLFALEVLRFMFGSQWDASAPLVPWYCLGGAMSAVVALVPTVMLAAGHPKTMASADLVFQPIKALIMVAVAFHFRTLEPVAIAFLVAATLQVPFFFVLKQRCLPTDLAALARQLARNAALTLVALTPAALLAHVLRPAGQALTLPVWLGCAGLTVVCWLAGLWLMRHPLRLELTRLLKRSLPQGSPS